MIRTEDGSDLLAEVMFQLSGVPEDVARRALATAIRAAAESCPMTAQFYVPTQACVADYPFDKFLPPQYEVVGVEFVKFCGCCLDPIDKCDPCPQGYSLDDMTHLTLYPAPSKDAGDHLEVCLSVRPGFDVCDYPADLLERCREDILHKMKGYLMEMPDKPWSNTQLAAYHLQQAKAGFDSLSVAVAKQFGKQQSCAVGERWAI